MIRFLDIKKVTDSFQPDLAQAMARVMDSGYFVRAAEVERFEKAYAAFTGTAHCVGVGNGFDALRLILRAWMVSGVMRDGDEVIVPANTYVASILAVSENRLTPVFVEPDVNTWTIDPFRIEEKITARTRAIMVVHLYGRNAAHPEILRLCRQYQLKLLEDNAQAAGCFCAGRRTGALGDAAGHSFFPTKNLGALGDGGAVTTNDPVLAETVRALGNYGSHRKGFHDLQGVNSRLDELQAAVLDVKLRRLDADNERRRTAASFYRRHITNSLVMLPSPATVANEHVWHLFVVRCKQRDLLRKYLLLQAIETMVHYPVPPHKQQAYHAMNHETFAITEALHDEALSLPLSPLMTEAELGRVVEAVNAFSV